MCDLDFTHLAGNRGAWYFINPAHDTFILQCESVPFWNTGGNNTFEIILSRPDSTITFQYKEQSGQPYGGWGNNNLTVGIENVTGYQAGLSYNHLGNPAWNDIHPGLAVKFIPPSFSSYTIDDVMCVNTMSRNSGGIFMALGIDRQVWVKVMNSGNQAVGAVDVSGEITDYNGMVVWNNTSQIAAMAIGQVDSIYLGAFNPPPLGYGTYTLKVKADHASDQYRTNDSILVEIHVIDYSLARQMSYDSMYGGQMSLADTHGYGVKFEPPRYPVWVDTLMFYFNSLAPINVFVYGDDRGRPGTVLDSIYWTPTTSGWNYLPIRDDSVSIQSGAFFVGYKTFGSTPSIGYDGTPPFSRQGWEFTGDWAPMRFNENRDMKIRVKVRPGFSNHNLGVGEILEPTEVIYDSGTVITPSVRMTNIGQFARDTGNVRFVLYDANSNVAYADTAFGVQVRRGADTVVTFRSWMATPGALSGVYTPRCSVKTYALDLDQSNDTLSGLQFFVRYTDAGVTTILQPPDTIGYGVSVTPTARVRNYGNQSLSNLVVKYQIGGVYLGVETLPVLGGRQSVDVTFDPWTADSGSFGIGCWTELAGDQVPGNDTAFGNVRVNLFDIGALRIDEPVGSVVESTDVYPLVTVKDYGTLGGTCDVRFRIRDAGNAVVYDTTQTNVTVPNGDTVQLRFVKMWDALPVGQYTSEAYTILAGDPNPANDTARNSFRVLPANFTDVGAVRIAAPGDSVSEFTPVYPQVRLYNYGTVVATCDLTVVVDADGNAPYDHTETLLNVIVPLGDTITRQFVTPWVATPQGPYQVWSYTVCGGDAEPANDTARSTTFVLPPPPIDVGVYAITAPIDTIDSTTAVTPAATLQNYWQLPATFRAIFRVLTGAGSQVYFDSMTVADLVPNVPTQFQFDAWTGIHTPGAYSARCSTYMIGDGNATNNVLGVAFVVRMPEQQVPAGWTTRAEMPRAPSTRYIKDGGWLTFNRGNGLIYAAKGYKSSDFYAYSPAADTWHSLTGMPVPAGSKLPSKGGDGCADGNGVIYALKGNNTLEFYKYDVVAGTWEALANVPDGPRTQRVKGGTDMVYVEQNDSGYVYLLKGYRNEFYRYNTVSGAWQTLALAPGGENARYDKCSFLSYDGDHTIYAHRAKYHELYLYDLVAGWSTTPHDGMGFVSRYTNRTRKSRDGGAGTWGRDGIYALKGANTLEFWHYLAASDTWTELETIPSVGTSSRRKRVKAGGSIVAYSDTVFYAFKGNKVNELWRYRCTAAAVLGVRPDRDGVAGSVSLPAKTSLTIVPNPLVGRFVSLRYSLPRAGVLALSVYDVSGRPVINRSLPLGRAGTTSLDLRGLSAGVYLVKLTGDGVAATEKLVIER